MTSTFGSASMIGCGETQPRTFFTAGAVGFFFSIRAALAMISARWLRLGSEPGVIANVMIESALLLAIILQAIGPAPGSLHWIVRQPTVRWVLLFLTFSCSSLLWSATVSRPASFLYWCAMAADVAMVVFLLRGASAPDVAGSAMRGFIAGTCILASVAWIMPATDDLRLGDPEYFNTNQIANLCALAIFMGQFLAARKDGKWTLPIVFLSVTLLRSLSKTTIIAFIVAEGFLLIYDKSMNAKKKAIIFAGMVLSVAMFSGLIASYFDAYTSTGNQAETLTGRTAIWIYTLDASFARPWFGNGIDAMWKVFPPFGKEMFEARHAENEWLQQFFAYGLAGVVMLAGLYGSLSRRILKLPRETAKGVLIAIMLFVLLRGLAEAEPFDLLLPLWMIVLLSSIVKGAAESQTHNEISTPPESPRVPAVAVTRSASL